MMIRMMNLYNIAIVVVSSVLSFVVAERVSPIVLPERITLRAAVIPTPPFGIIAEDGSVSGFHYDLIEAMKEYAEEDGVIFDITLEESPEVKYGPALNWIANDCNTTANPVAREDCDTYDLILGDYYVNSERAVRVNFAPAYLRTSMTTVKFLEKTKPGPEITTMQQAINADATVCALDGTYLSKFIMGVYPEADWRLCGPGLLDCIEDVKRERCVLYVEDEHKLKYRAVHDFSLEVTREVFSRQYYVWPMSFEMDPVVVTAIKKWMYTAVARSRLDELYFKYFEIKTCPVGKAGENCELSCDPDHGTSDKTGTCVCSSSRWTGDDCSIEVPEELNLIPPGLKWAGIVAFGVNVLACFICALWLLIMKGHSSLKFAQPFFLVLVLIGCVTSSSTIIALSQEDEGDGPVPACMAIPWLYSVGFCITFGTLFAKLRRTYILFQSAAAMKRVAVTVNETLAVIGGLVLVDAVVLIAWTIVDPLKWERVVVSKDVFGHPLESVGHCTSDNWEPFAATIAFLHFALLAIACWYCYVSRNIPDQFSEGKYITVAMISNMQIFVVGIPVLLIIGSDSGTGFFVRSVIIWMNDIVVVMLIFGHLMKSVHYKNGGVSQRPEELRSVVNTALRRYSQSQKPSQAPAGSQYGSSTYSQSPETTSWRNSHASPTPFAVSHLSIDEDCSVEFGTEEAAAEAAAQIEAEEKEEASKAQQQEQAPPPTFKRTSWTGIEEVPSTPSVGTSDQRGHDDYEEDVVPAPSPSFRLTELKKCEPLMEPEDYQKKYMEIASTIVSPHDRLKELKKCEEFLSPEDFQKKVAEIIKEI